MTQTFKITVTVTPVDEKGKPTSKKRLTLKNFKGRRYPMTTPPKPFNPADLER